MSERVVSITKNMEISIGWTDIFMCAKELLKKIEPTDVRWAHVQIAREVYDGMQTLFDAHQESKELGEVGEEIEN